MIHFPSPDKILLLGVIALIVLGPTRLPGAARTAGRWVGEVRKLSARFQSELHGALGDQKDELTAAVGTFRTEVGSLRTELHGMVLGSDTTATASPGSPVEPAAASSSDPWTPSVSSGVAPAGLPPLPPVPDDPSLN